MTEPSTYTLYRRGRRLLDEGRARDALPALERAASREPGSPSLQEALGRAYFQTRRTDAAEAAFANALAHDPTDAYAHFGLACCHERHGRLTDAVRHLRLACALVPRAAYRRHLERIEARLAA